MSESIEELQKKLKEFKRTPEGIARTLRIDLAGIAWRRMLELNWSMAELAARTSWPATRVQEFLNAEESSTEEIGVIMHAMGLQLTFATRAKPQPTEQKDQPIEQKDRPKPTPFQEYMDEWYSGETSFPTITHDDDGKESARLIWNQACGQMTEFLRKKPQPELKLAAFYTLLDRAFCSVAEPKPAGKSPDDQVDKGA